MSVRHATTPIKQRKAFPWVLMTAGLSALFSVGPAVADVSYYVFGRATSVYGGSETIEASSTVAIPGVETAQPEVTEVAAAVAGPLPGVTIEVYDASSNMLLGVGQANREGYYNVGYNLSVEESHRVRFVLYLDFADGARKSVGAVDTTASGESIVVSSRLFRFDLEVETEEAIRAGAPLFSDEGEFVFVEVGDVDMNDIYDAQADAAEGATLWGFTKGAPLVSGSSPGDAFPNHAFGGKLELYGLFAEGTGPADSAQYYRITYSGSASGAVCDPLYKNNFVLVGSQVEVYPVKLGPKSITTSDGIVDCVYELDERKAGEAIPDLPPGSPPRFYSHFWTELGLRAKWNTVGLPNGLYELSGQAWNAVGVSLDPAANDYATLSLQINNDRPKSTIHSVAYLDGTTILDDSSPCQTVVLDRANTITYDDSLRFNITASHAGNLLWRWSLDAWHGHNQSDGPIAGATYSAPGPLLNQVDQAFDTPSSITYQSCAYRYRLRVWPRITNGYHRIYIRDDNWYASVSVQEGSGATP